jgi:hypothetical protein
MPKGSSFPAEILTGLNGPYGVGVDAARNIYFDEYFKGTLSRLTPGSSSPEVLLTGLDHPNFMSVDSAGDVYFITGQTCGDKIVRYDSSSGKVATILIAPQPHDSNHGFGGIFVDSSDNLYYTTCDYMSLNLLVSGSSAPSVILNTTSRPTGLVADKMGNVFFALYNSSIDEVPVGSKTPLVLTTEGSSRLQVTIDQEGNLYYSDYVGGRVWEIALQSSANQVATSTTTATSTAVITSILSSTTTLTAVPISTQTAPVAPSTITLASLSLSTQTTTETYTASIAPSTITLATVSYTTQTLTESYTNSKPGVSSAQILTKFIDHTTTQTTILAESTNGPPFASAVIVGLLLALSLLAAYFVLNSRKPTVPVTPQPSADQNAIETVDGIVLKYLNDHRGEISISTTCSDLGIPEQELRDSIQRLIDKGVLSK